MATAAGTAKTTRKIGASSATEYPALATLTHMLIAAPTSQIGTNHRAALPGDYIRVAGFFCPYCSVSKPACADEGIVLGEAYAV